MEHLILVGLRNLSGLASAADASEASVFVKAVGDGGVSSVAMQPLRRNRNSQKYQLVFNLQNRDENHSTCSKIMLVV
jgi:hypothetical protein